MQRRASVRTQARTRAPARSRFSVIAPRNQSWGACCPVANIGETATVLPAGRVLPRKRTTPAGSGVGVGVGAGVDGVPGLPELPPQLTTADTTSSAARTRGAMRMAHLQELAAEDRWRFDASAVSGIAGIGRPAPRVCQWSARRL